MRNSHPHPRPAVSGRVGLLAILALTIGASIPHLALKSSNPEQDSMIMEWPETVELTFTGPVNPKMSRADLTIGDTEIRLDLFESPDEVTLTFTVPTGLGHGPAELEWVATGSDGHPISGVVRFHVGTHEES